MIFYFNEFEKKGFKNTISHLNLSFMTLNRAIKSAKMSIYQSLSNYWQRDSLQVGNRLFPNICTFYWFQKGRNPMISAKMLQISQKYSKQRTGLQKYSSFIVLTNTTKWPRKITKLRTIPHCSLVVTKGHALENIACKNNLFSKYCTAIL